MICITVDSFAVRSTMIQNISKSKYKFLATYSFTGSFACATDSFTYFTPSASLRSLLCSITLEARNLKRAESNLASFYQGILDDVTVVAVMSR